MAETAAPPVASLPRKWPARALPVLFVGVAGLVFVAWLLGTPPGLLGKADAVAYAVCHRIDGRSFHIGDRQLPLCARCTGIYLGALVGMAALALMGRRAGGLPTRRMLVILFGFIAVMGFDGVNSYLTLFPGLPHLYEPQNWLRLVTGTFNGLAMASLTYPVLNQTLWRNWENRPVLARFRHLGVLIGLGLFVIALVLTNNPVILYPLALLSALGVVVLLTALDTTFLLILTRRDGRIERWTGALLPLLAGFTLAIMQIGLVDAVRFAVFRTWGGFVFPG